MVLLSGEAGIGKSRLVQVLKEHVAAEPQAWLTPCQCSPYYQNTALYPMIDLLERVALRFEREESPPQKLRKLEGFVVQYGLPLAEAVPLLASLLSLPPPADYALLTMPPEQQKQQTLHTLLTIFLRVAAQQPMLFVMEDLRTGRSPRWNCSDSWWIKVPPYPRPVYLSARLQPALDRANFHPGHRASVAPASGCRGNPPGGARQGFTFRGRRADCGQNGWGAAVCRGTDQDGSGVRSAPGVGRSLRTHQSSAAAGHPACTTR